jgi:hypothetical protein
LYVAGGEVNVSSNGRSLPRTSERAETCLSGKIAICPDADDRAS